MRAKPLTMDPWNLEYRKEKQSLQGDRKNKPSILDFFTDDPLKAVRERRSTPYGITHLYKTDEIFGEGKPHRIHLRDYPVTFEQIWQRANRLEKWERLNQDDRGELIIEDMKCQIQLQRHHLPGSFFIEREGGSLDINVPSKIPPDVYFRLVDAEGQRFARCATKVHNLKMTVEIEEGQAEVIIRGIDGEDFTVDIRHPTSVTIPGKGMPKDWSGTKCGDLILDVLVL
jgi:hypothetical protein